jgi:L-fuconolactonase
VAGGVTTVAAAGAHASAADLDEAVIDPTRIIIDAHHHLGDKPKARYLLPELMADLGSGHNVRATVFMEWRSMYRARGLVEMRPVGEVEFVNGIAAQAASGQYGDCLACAGIVGSADLSLGDRVEPILWALIHAGNGRFRGVRPGTKWHESGQMHGAPFKAPRDLMRQPGFQAGANVLGRLGLTLDIWGFQSQLADVLDLARAAPGTTLIVNHVGGPLASGPYAGRRDEMYPPWRSAMAELARLPHVVVKLGGLGVPSAGFAFDRPPTSATLATAWRPYIDTAIELFGVERCMFESNFPVDRRICSYRVLWNAFKRIVATASTTDRDMLFAGTAARIYRLAVA